MTSIGSSHGIDAWLNWMKQTNPTLFQPPSNPPYDPNNPTGYADPSKLKWPERVHRTLRILVADHENPKSPPPLPITQNWFRGPGAFINKPSDISPETLCDRLHACKGSTMPPWVAVLTCHGTVAQNEKELKEDHWVQRIQAKGVKFVHWAVAHSYMEMQGSVQQTGNNQANALNGLISAYGGDGILWNNELKADNQGYDPRLEPEFIHRIDDVRHAMPKIWSVQGAPSPGNHYGFAYELYKEFGWTVAPQAYANEFPDLYKPKRCIQYWHDEHRFPISQVVVTIGIYDSAYEPGSWWLPLLNEAHAAYPDWRGWNVYLGETTLPSDWDSLKTVGGYNA